MIRFLLILMAIAAPLHHTYASLFSKNLIPLDAHKNPIKIQCESKEVRGKTAWHSSCLRSVFFLRVSQESPAENVLELSLISSSSKENKNALIAYPNHNTRINYAQVNNRVLNSKAWTSTRIHLPDFSGELIFLQDAIYKDSMAFKDFDKNEYLNTTYRKRVPQLIKYQEELYQHEDLPFADVYISSINLLKSEKSNSKEISELQSLLSESEFLPFIKTSTLHFLEWVLILLIGLLLLSSPFRLSIQLTAAVMLPLLVLYFSLPKSLKDFFKDMDEAKYLQVLEQSNKQMKLPVKAFLHSNLKLVELYKDYHRDMLDSVSHFEAEKLKPKRVQKDIKDFLSGLKKMKPEEKRILLSNLSREISQNLKIFQNKEIRSFYENWFKMFEKQDHIAVYSSPTNRYRAHFAGEAVLGMDLVLLNLYSFKYPFTMVNNYYFYRHGLWNSVASNHITFEIDQVTPSIRPLPFLYSLVIRLYLNLSLGEKRISREAHLEKSQSIRKMARNAGFDSSQIRDIFDSPYWPIAEPSQSANRYSRPSIWAPLPLKGHPWLAFSRLNLTIQIKNLYTEILNLDKNTGSKWALWGPDPSNSFLPDLDQEWMQVFLLSFKTPSIIRRIVGKGDELRLIQVENQDNFQSLRVSNSFPLAKILRVHAQEKRGALLLILGIFTLLIVLLYWLMAKLSHSFKKLGDQMGKVLEGDFEIQSRQPFISDLFLLNKQIQVQIEELSKMQDLSGFLSSSASSKIEGHSENQLKEVGILFLSIMHHHEDSSSQAWHKHLEPIQGILVAHGFWIDKFTGSSLVAVLENQKHPDFVKLFTEFEDVLGQDTNLFFGAGYNFGEALLGQVGSKKRSDYTVIGSSVNLAARLAYISKKEGINSLHLFGDIATLLESEKLQNLGPREIKGLQEKPQVWRIS